MAMSKKQAESAIGNAKSQSEKNAIARKYVDSKKSSSSSSSSGSSSSSSSSTLAVQEQQNQAISDWKSGKITQQQASDIIKNIQRGGGSGSASNSVKQQAYQASLNRASLEEQKLAIANRESQIQQEILSNRSKSNAIAYAQEQAKQEEIRNKYAPEGTVVDTSNNVNIKVKTTPYVERRVVDTFKDESTGRSIPVTEDVYVDPTGLGPQKERPATQDETKQLDESSGYFVSSEKRSNWQNIKEPVVAGYEELNKDMRESFTNPVAKVIVDKTKNTVIGGETGLTLEKAKQNIAESSAWIKNKTNDNKFIGAGVNVNEFIAGVGIGAVEDVREKPLKQVLIYGAGAVVGGVTKGAEFGVTKLGAKFGDNAVNAVLSGNKVSWGTKVGLGIPGAYSTAVNVGGLGMGAYYVSQTAPNIINADSPLEAGQLTGVALKDIGLFGAGSQAGTKGAEKLYDWKVAKNRVEIPIEDVGLKTISEVLSGNKKFVESSQFGGSNTPGFNKQAFDLKTFEQAGRTYTVSPTQFYDSKFIAQPGTSEVAGLYSAPSPSVYFGKAGTDYGKLFGLYKASGSPNVVMTQNVGGKFFTDKAGLFKVGNQLTGVNPGTGYVTGMKPEIETVWGAGTGFEITGKDVFFRYNGRVFPVNTANIIDVPITNTLNLPNLGGSSGSSSYGGVPLVSPISGFTPVTSGSSSSYTTASVNLPLPTVTSSSASSSTTSSSLKLPPVTSSGGSSREKSSSSSSSGSSVGSSISSIISSSKPSSSKKSSGSSLPRGYNPYRSSSSGSSSSGWFSSGSSFSSSKSGKSKSYASFKLPKEKTFKQPRGLFGVEVRRGGKFYNIGTGSLKQVQALGQKRTSTTLAATYKITGGKLPGLKLPKGYYAKTTKGGVEIIEKVGRRLKKGSGEITEIFRAKASKKKSTKRKKK